MIYLKKIFLGIIRKSCGPMVRITLKTHLVSEFA